MALEHGEPLDEAVYCEVMFDAVLSGEVPEHRDFIYEKAIPTLERMGVKVRVLRSEQTYVGLFTGRITRGPKKGLLRSFPIAGRCAVQRDCKLKPIRQFQRTLPLDTVQYIGIAKDEFKRLQRLKKGQGQVPVKESGRMSDISRYGGYGSAKNTYFMLVEAEDKKKKESLWILPVPLYLKQKIESSEEYARSYFEQEYSLCHVRVLKKIRIQTLFVYEGFRMRLAGRSGSQLVFHNANELCLPARHHNTIRQISKHIQELQYDRDAAISDNGLLTEQDLDALYTELCEKLKGSVYQTMLGGYIEKYEAGYEKYQKLTLEKKAQALWQMLKIFQCTPEMPDLTLIGGSKSQGAIRMGMNVTGRKSLALIHQSVTGIYERVEKIRG